MKKLILGMGIFICGMIILCTDYTVDRVISAMPDVSVMGHGVLSLSLIAVVLMLAGLVLAIIGFKDNG